MTAATTTIPHCSAAAYGSGQRHINWSRFEYVFTRMRSHIDRLLDSLSGPPPYSPEKYAALCSADVSYEEITPAGRLMPAPGNRFVIQVRGDQSEARRNFTICHELGHILFKTKSLFPGRHSEPGSILIDRLIEERICEQIAVALLMPETEFKVS